VCVDRVKISLGGQNLGDNFVFFFFLEDQNRNFLKLKELQLLLSLNNTTQFLLKKSTTKFFLQLCKY